MVFNSAQFLLFLPLAALGYFAVPQKARRPWLLLACYFFYFCWNPAHVPVLAFVTAVGYLGGRLLEGKPRKGVLAAGILLALAPLIGFKYLGFLTKSVLSVLAHLGVQIAPPAFDFLLPMGISFYTLQAVGYLVDTYRGEKAEHNLLDFALFVGFFPQMVSGPISRGNRLLPQLSAAKRPAFDDLRDGVLLLIWGYFLKIVVADRAALFVAAVYAPESEYEGWFYIVATLLFCLQLYGDFGGCSVMAMGTAKILGIDLIDNFNAPYFSQSIAEFWRRWHISLSTWFRDYLYIPLGGNRKGTLRKYLNVLVTFAVSGLWHGAQWNYMAWGLLNGLYQVIGAALMPLRTAVVRALHIDPKSRPHKLLRVVVTFVLFSSTMVFFRAYRLMDAVRIFISMLTVHNFEIFTDGSIWCEQCIECADTIFDSKECYYGKQDHDACFLQRSFLRRDDLHRGRCYLYGSSAELDSAHWLVHGCYRHAQLPQEPPQRLAGYRSGCSEPRYGFQCAEHAA